MEARLKALQKTLYPKLHELRETESWRRWANVNVQEELCQRVEALANHEDLAEVARELREMVAQWKTVATVPREQAAHLWQRFKTAHDQAYARCEKYFAEQAEERKTNLKRRIALCEQVEVLATSTNWLKTAARIVELQAEWKAIGGVPRKHSQATWKRFRGACDQFFERRKADLKQQKEVWAKNYSQREELCQQAEALAKSADAEAVKTVRRLEVEWRKIGPVKRSMSNAIWQRFRAACIKISERLTEQEEARLADQIAARETICANLEAPNRLPRARCRQPHRRTWQNRWQPFVVNGNKLMHYRNSVPGSSVPDSMMRSVCSSRVFPRHFVIRTSTRR